MEPSLDDVFWSRAQSNRGIDCRSFVALCKDSKLVDDTFLSSSAELVFQKSMPLSLRRLDLERLKDALRRVAEFKQVDAQVVHRQVIDYYTRVCEKDHNLKRCASLPAFPGLTRIVSEPALGSRTDSPKNDGHARHRSSSGTKRHKHRSKKGKGEDTDKSVQLLNTSEVDVEHRRAAILLCPSAAPAQSMQLPFSPVGQSQMSTTPGEVSLRPPPLADGADADVHNVSPCQTPAGQPTPSSVTSTALMSVPNTPSWYYQSCPASPTNQTHEQESPLSCSTLQLPSCSPANVMLHHAVRPPDEVVESALAIQLAQEAPSLQTHWEPAPEEGACASTGGTPCSAQLLPLVPTPEELGEAGPLPHEQPAESGHQPSTVGSVLPTSPPVPRLPLGVCTDDLDQPSLLSSRQPSHGATTGLKTLKRPARSGKSMTRVVSLPAPIDTGSDMAQLVSDTGLGERKSLKSPGRPSSGLFHRESPNVASGSGKLEDGHSDQSRGTVEATFKAFCGEHGDMDSKSFVKLCRKCGLFDGQKFTTQDARLAFTETVPFSQVRMDLQSFESALAHVAAKRGLDKGVISSMVSFYEQPEGAPSAPTSPSHEHMPIALPDSPLAKVAQRPSSASRSRTTIALPDSAERPSQKSIGRQSQAPAPAPAG